MKAFSTSYSLNFLYKIGLLYGRLWSFAKKMNHAIQALGFLESEKAFEICTLISKTFILISITPPTKFYFFNGTGTWGVRPSTVQPTELAVPRISRTVPAKSLARERGRRTLQKNENKKIKGPGSGVQTDYCCCLLREAAKKFFS